MQDITWWLKSGGEINKGKFLDTLPATSTLREGLASQPTKAEGGLMHVFLQLALFLKGTTLKNVVIAWYGKVL